MFENEGIKMNHKIDWKKPQWTCVLASMICGTVAHLFGLVTMLQNLDNIGQQPAGYGTGVTSGRWLLSLLGDLTGMLRSDYNLPLVNGLLFLLLIAFASGFIVLTLDIRNRRSAAFVGMLMSVFPTVVSTMYFRYTTVYYGIAILLSVLAAWVLEKHRYGLLLSALCVAGSMGIYQAYVPFTITLFVMVLLRRTLEGEGFWKILRQGLKECAALILGLAFYYLCLKICLKLYHTELSDYNGVQSMYHYPLSSLPELIKEAVYGVVMLPLKNYCGLANLPYIRLCYVAIGLLSAGMVVWILVKGIRRWDSTAMAAVLLVLLVVAVNFIVIMCPNSWLYTLMVYPFALIGYVPLMLLEILPQEQGREKNLARKLVSIVLAVLIFGYAYDTNIGYSAVYYATCQVENYVTSLVTQVRMTEGFTTDKEWVFLGTVEDPLLYNPWGYEHWYLGSMSARDLLSWDSYYSWIQHYCGYTIPLAEDSVEDPLWQNQTVKDMPCWPNEGSVKVVDDYIVIKFQEQENS